jgi:hypothetical protein
MSEFLASVKADLLDRRLLPIVALLALALVAAIAYVVLGGGSAATSTAAVTAAPASVPAGLSVTQTTPETAVAETTGGATEQRRGAARNPFTPLPEPKAKTAATSATTSSSSSSSTSSSSSSGGSGSSSQGSGGSSPTTPSKPSTAAKPKTVYHVSILFGELPADLPPAQVPLTATDDLKLLTPLPSPQLPLIVFRGVTVGGKSATFTISGEEILHGEAICLPSASQCEAIDLKPGQTEQLEYISATGGTVVEELRIVSIVSAKATSAAFKGMLRGESKAGRKLLEHAGLISIPDLRYSAQAGVLVFAGHPAFAARARAAAARAAARRRQGR